MVNDLNEFKGEQKDFSDYIVNISKGNKVTPNNSQLPQSLEKTRENRASKFESFT